MMKKFKVVICHGTLGTGYDFCRTFIVLAPNIVAAQIRVLNRVRTWTSSNMFYLSSTEEVKDD